MRRWYSAVPALIASLLLTFLPACASRPALAGGHGEIATGPIENPHVVVRHAPRDADIPVRIDRSAGEFCPPSIHAAGDGAWAVALFYLFIFLGYSIGWCFYNLGELIWEAIHDDSRDGDE